MHIHRDDLLEGGTKRRALKLMLQELPQSRFLYAGTTMGHGALALSHACMDMGKQAEIYISATDDHPMVHKLWNTNAVVHLQPPLPVKALNDMALAQAQHGYVLPPGFNMPEFEAALIRIFKEFDVSPYSEIWTTAVTGTLTRAFTKAYPDKAFHTVKVVKQPCDLGHAKTYAAPEKYHQPALMPPPYPSCPYTDAKLWQFASVHALSDALIWNTAG